MFEYDRAARAVRRYLRAVAELGQAALASGGIKSVRVENAMADGQAAFASAARAIGLMSRRSITVDGICYTVVAMADGTPLFLDRPPYAAPR